MKQDQILPPPSSPSVLKRKTTTADASCSRLLLVEDNAINMKLLATYVRQLGYAFDTATDGSLALDYYKKTPQKPAVILMDISMPVMDGFTSARLIRAYEAKENLPAATIIALTGLASASAQQESYSSGINLFLSKPVPMKIVKKVLEDLHL
jgi:CheY-like chemotaxis protein